MRELKCCNNMSFINVLVMKILNSIFSSEERNGKICVTLVYVYYDDLARQSRNFSAIHVKSNSLTPLSRNNKEIILLKKLENTIYHPIFVL